MCPLAAARAGHGWSGRRPLALTTPDQAHFASFPKGDSTRWLLCPLWSPAWPPCGRQGFEKLQTPAADKSTHPQCPRHDHHRAWHPSIGGCGTWSPHQRVTHRPTPSDGGDVNRRAGVSRLHHSRNLRRGCRCNQANFSQPFVLLDAGSFSQGNTPPLGRKLRVVGPHLSPWPTWSAQG